MQLRPDGMGGALEMGRDAPPHVLILDAEPAIAEVLKLALETGVPCRVSRAATPLAAVTVLRRDRPRAAIVGIRMPARLGIAVAGQALALGVSVLLTAGDLKTRMALHANGVRFLAKPFHLSDVVEETRRLVTEGEERRVELTLQLARFADNLARLGAVVEDARAAGGSLQALLYRVPAKL